MSLQNFISEIAEPEELWVDIPDYENLYMISSNGRVLAKEKLVNNGYKDVLKSCRLLKNHESEGRLSIQLTKEGKSKKIQFISISCFRFSSETTR